MRSPRRSTLSAGLAALLVAGCTTAPTITPAAPEPVAPTIAPSTPPAATASPSPMPLPTPTPSPQALTSELLVERLRHAGAEAHLAAFQAIADRHGGRSNGSPGYADSLAYVVDRLDALGYDVALRPFAIDGVAGTNVIAERAGRGDEIVMLGAHLDSVAGSPGMNDNASGVAALLVIAEALVDLPEPERTIRLAFWDAEEGGRYGSRRYVDGLDAAELDRIVACLNLDMVGSPNPLRLVYAEADAPPGSGRITDLFAAHFDAGDLAWEPVDLEGDSDHGPFNAAGVPTGGLFSGGIEPVTAAQAERFGAVAGVPADACSHAPCDRIENVDLGTLGEMTRAAAHVLAALANGAAP